MEIELNLKILLAEMFSSLSALQTHTKYRVKICPGVFMFSHLIKCAYNISIQENIFESLSDL